MAKEQPKLVTILSSKRLSKSFKQVDSHLIWQSMPLPIGDAIKVVEAALNNFSKNSEPLTITILNIGD